MFKKMRLVSFCMVLVLLTVIISACGVEKKTTGEMPKVYLYMNNGAASAGNSSNEDVLQEIKKYIMDKVGIEPIIVMPPAGAEKEKLNMLLSSNENIDVFWQSWNEYRANNIIIPLNDLIEKKGKDLQQAYSENAWRAMTDKEGKIWGIPRNTDAVNFPVYIRKDWLSKYGLSMPKTTEDLEKVLRAFKEKDPAGNSSTIPMIIQLDSIRKGLSAGFTGVGYGQWLDTSDNKIKPVELNPEYKNMLVLLNKWYKEGLIYRESFIIKRNQIREYIKQNKVGVHIEWASNITLFEPELKKSFPEANYDIAEIDGPKGKSETVAKTSQNAAMITKKSKNPEAAMTLLNWPYKNMDDYLTICFGAQGVHWKYSNNEKSNLAIEFISENKGKYMGEYNFALGPLERKIDVNDVTLKKHYDYLKKHSSNFARATYPLDFNTYYDNKRILEEVPRQGDIQRMLDEETVAFITGAKPISEYDNFIANLYKIGLDNWIDSYTKQYNELNK